MLKYLKKDRWSSYIVGILLAVLSIISFFFFEEMLGTATTFVRIAAGLWYMIAPEHVHNNAYYFDLLNNNYWITWQAALIIGIFIGSYIAGNLYKKSPVTHVPSIWRDRFGSNRTKRYLGTFLGGVIILFGARLAGGCTSGHAIAGGMQLAVSGWAFMIGLFAIGVPTALIIYTYPKRK